MVLEQHRWRWLMPWLKSLKKQFWHFVPNLWKQCGICMMKFTSDLKCNNIRERYWGTGNYSEVYTASSDRLWESNNSRTRKTLLPLWKWKDLRRYSHFAPEVVEGLTKQSKMSMLLVYAVLIRMMYMSEWCTCKESHRWLLSQMSFSKIFVQAYCAKWNWCWNWCYLSDLA